MLTVEFSGLNFAYLSLQSLPSLPGLVELPCRYHSSPSKGFIE